MVLRNFTYGTDNITGKITKEDKQNVDTATFVVPFGTGGEVGDEINFFDENGDLAFAGYIESKDTTGAITYLCEDYGSILKRSIINKIYSNQLPEEIIEDVVVSAGLTYVSTITTTEQIPIYPANKKNSQEIVSELADRLLANYSTDVNKNFRLELEGGQTSTRSISNSNGIKDGAWEEDITELVNSVYVEGDSRSIFGTEESFDGTGAQTEFILEEIPVDLTVEHPVGTILTGYVEDQSTGDYQIVREESKIIFDTPPASGTNNIKVNYTYSIPVVSRRRNKQSIDLYGERSAVVRKNWILTRDDAKAYANFMITNFASPLINSTWNMIAQVEIDNWQQYLPNDLIFVNDNLTNISGNYVIRKVERRYDGTGFALKITVGSRERNMSLWDKEVADRIRQLEQRDDNSTILNEDELVTEELKVEFTTSVVQIKSIGKGTAWVLDDPTNSQLDAGFQLDGGDDIILFP